MVEKQEINQGIECPRCGCRHLPALFSRRKGRLMIRLRVCRHCGKRVRTVEKEVKEGMSD